MPWQAYLILAGLSGIGALVWWAQRQASAVQRALDKAAGAAEKLETVEKSNEVAEVGDSRRDPRLHDVADVVPELPGWSRRD